MFLRIIYTKYASILQSKEKGGKWKYNSLKPFQSQCVYVYIYIYLIQKVWKISDLSRSCSM